MTNLEQQWDEVLLAMSKHFGITANYDFLLFMVGIQEKGCGFINFSKQDKMDLINLAKCRMLEREGMLEENGEEEGWALFTPKLTYLSLSDGEKDEIIKRQMIDYLKQTQQFIN